MDPVTAVVVGAALLGGTAVWQQLATPPEGALRIRRILRWPDGWMATEILSDAALSEVGEIFDLDTNRWLPEIRAGVARVFVLAQLGAPLARQVVLRTASRGDQWICDVAYHKGMGKVADSLTKQRIAEVIAAVNQTARSLDFGTKPVETIGSYTIWAIPTLFDLDRVALVTDVDIDDYMAANPDRTAFLVKDSLGDVVAVFTTRPEGTLDAVSAPGGRRTSRDVADAIGAFAAPSKAVRRLPSDDDLDELVFTPNAVAIGA